METTVQGTFIDGIVRLDRLIDLPNNSRVIVQISPAAEQTVSPKEAWQQLKDRLKARPIRSGGQHFTRDELHERR